MRPLFTNRKLNINKETNQKWNPMFSDSNDNDHYNTYQPTKLVIYCSTKPNIYLNLISFYFPWKNRLSLFHHNKTIIRIPESIANQFFDINMLLMKTKNIKTTLKWTIVDRVCVKHAFDFFLDTSMQQVLKVHRKNTT